VLYDCMAILSCQFSFTSGFNLNRASTKTQAHLPGRSAITPALRASRWVSNLRSRTIYSISHVPRPTERERKLVRIRQTGYKTAEVELDSSWTAQLCGKKRFWLFSMSPQKDLYAAFSLGTKRLCEEGAGVFNL